LSRWDHGRIRRRWARARSTQKGGVRMNNVTDWTDLRRPTGGVQLAIALLACFTILPGTAIAQSEVSISSCPGQSLPVSCQIDCSHVKDPANKEQCRPFIQNQACTVFPAYRQITGIELEKTCKSIKFTIYDDENWPHRNGEGGLAGNCSVDYLAKYS